MRQGLHEVGGAGDGEQDPDFNRFQFEPVLDAAVRGATVLRADGAGEQRGEDDHGAGADGREVPEVPAFAAGDHGGAAGAEPAGVAVGAGAVAVPDRRAVEPERAEGVPAGDAGSAGVPEEGEPERDPEEVLAGAVRGRGGAYGPEVSAL